MSARISRITMIAGLLLEILIITAMLGFAVSPALGRGREGHQSPRTGDPATRKERIIAAKLERHKELQDARTNQATERLSLDEETFEGAFPGTFWHRGDTNPGSGEDYWGKEDCCYYAGTYGCWCAKVGSTADCQTGSYDDNMEAYMYVEAEYGGLADDGSDKLHFKIKTDYGGQQNIDYAILRVEGYICSPGQGNTSVPDAVYEDALTGDTGWRWISKNVSLGAAFDECWYVRVRFGFHSNGSGSAGKGACLDDIVFYNDTDASIDPIEGGFPPCEVSSDFDADEYTVCTGQSVQFESWADCATAWLWQFGDGATSTQENPMHAYANPGSYTVSLTAYNGTGCSDVWTETDFIDVWGIPQTPSACSATENNCNGVEIAWTDNSSGYREADGFKVFRNGTLIGQTPLTTYTDSGAPVCQTSSYTVKAFNDCGDSPASNADNGTRISAPAAPSACAATDNLCDRVRVAWTDNSSGVCGEASFKIFRNGAQIGTAAANATSYDDTGAPQCQTSTYTVKAANNCGDSPASNGDSGTRLGPPAAPSACSASDDHVGEVVVTWTASSGGICAVAQYAVYRDGAQVGLVSAPSTTFTDHPECGVGKVYWIIARNSCGDSGASNQDAGICVAAVTDLIVAATELAPSTVCDTVRAIRALVRNQGNTPCGGSITAVSIDGTELCRFETPPLSPGADAQTPWCQVPVSPGTHAVRVCADADNQIPEGNEENNCSTDQVERQVAPVAPDSCIAQDAAVDSIVVRWRDRCSGFNQETGFQIVRDGACVATVGADRTSYTDALGGECGTHVYSIRAFNGCGRSAASNDDRGSCFWSLSEVSPGAAGPAVDKTVLPNPYRRNSDILVYSARPGVDVSMSLYDIQGREVRTLYRGVSGTDRIRFSWDGRADNGRPCGAGIYYMVGRIGETRCQKKLLLIE